MPNQQTDPRTAFHQYAESQKSNNTPALLITLPFHQYAESQKSNNTPALLWKDWVSGSVDGSRHKPSVIKVILMVKDEWPLLRQWIVYHGDLLGFENLYVLDGSTEAVSIKFLEYARDELGVRVIFSNANLNELRQKINRLAQTLRDSTHFILKMDPDEFLALKTEAPACDHVAEGKVDCTLSPYGLSEYLTDKVALSSLFDLANQGPLRIGHTIGSLPNRELCESGRGDEIGYSEFNGGTPTLPVRVFKTIYDTRIMKNINLGGHVERSDHWPPYNREPLSSPLAVIHFHYRCLEHAINNTRKASIGHNYILATDSPEEELRKLLQFFKKRDCHTSPCECGLEKMRPGMKSRHKVYFYIQYLSGCDNASPENFYPPERSDFWTNPDFRTFLDSSMAKYPWSEAKYAHA